MADSVEKLGRLVSEFGRVCERKRLRVNVGTTKVMRCSRYGNGDRVSRADQRVLRWFWACGKNG